MDLCVKIVKNPPPVGIVLPICSPPPPPWYIQIAPDLILLAGITSVILAFYLSPELRNGFKTLINKYRK
ncbi:MAG: hypothetical protein RXQ80_06005 [Sulfolobaceae archaeon]